MYRGNGEDVWDERFVVRGGGGCVVVVVDGSFARSGDASFEEVGVLLRSFAKGEDVGEPFESGKKRRTLYKPSRSVIHIRKKMDISDIKGGVNEPRLEPLEIPNDLSDPVQLGDLLPLLSFVPFLLPPTLPLPPDLGVFCCARGRRKDDGRGGRGDGCVGDSSSVKGGAEVKRRCCCSLVDGYRFMISYSSCFEKETDGSETNENPSFELQSVVIIPVSSHLFVHHAHIRP
jgi:hypothetical protein